MPAGPCGRRRALSLFGRSVGELVAVKEELVAEKQEKLQLSRELLTLQLSASEQNASQQQHTHVLEQVRAEL